MSDPQPSAVAPSGRAPGPVASIYARLRSPGRLRAGVDYAAMAVVAFVPMLASQPGTVTDDTKTYLYLDPGRYLRQAVSLWKAVQTQAWKQEAGEQLKDMVEPVFSFRAINYLMRQLTAHDASWDAYFLGLGYEPLKVTYEELADSTEGVVHSVLEHLGIAAPQNLQIGPPRLSVQADEVSERWVERVQEHLAALEAPEPA